MNQSAKEWWLSLYGLVCICLFLPLAIWGIRDPISLTPLIVEGGLIESLPVIFLSLTSVLCLAIGVQLRQKQHDCEGWIYYSGLCLFLAGEETSWGREGVLGWRALTGPDTEKWDLHTWVLGMLKGNLGMLERNDLILMATGVTVVCMLLLLILQKKEVSITTACGGLMNRLPHMFLLLGLVMIVMAGLFDTLWEIGLPYFPGQWPLEESLELLGSVAFLFGVLTRIQAEVQSSRALTGGRLANSWQITKTKTSPPLVK
ncbi:MAG: hypothetical protein ACE5E2_06030 [Candidatus Binatia bacterium]